MVRQAPKKTTERVVTKHTANKVAIELVAKTPKQAEYIKALQSADQVIVFGPSGTGKTHVVSSYAASLYHMNTINKIVITRPHVAVGKELGFLKGDLEEKTKPWAMPVIDVLEEYLGKAVVETGLKNGNIEIAPLALMRGRSFNNAFIICDETQNITFHELKMLLTRVGENTKLVINGDIMQSDLKEADGLSKVVHLVKKHMLPVPIIEFGVSDIVRSDMTKMWVETFVKEGI
jgi:phosphate starvation-inducible protein PhoH and related proteins